MKKCYLFSQCILLVVLTFVVGIQAVHAQWSSDPDVNNPICTKAKDQTSPVSASDGAGGAIIAWTDYRNGTENDVYAQRIKASGVLQWKTDGVPIAVAANDKYVPVITGDGSGGAIIAWEDNRSGISRIYAQRINAGGLRLWTAGGDSNGIPVSNANNLFTPAIWGDGAGGAIIAWEDARTGNFDIYVQRLNPSGIRQWIAGSDSNGVLVCNATNSQNNPTLTSDGSGGAIITWEDHRGSNADIYAQRINVNGVRQWISGKDSNGVGICKATGDQTLPKIISSTGGSAIITWTDARGTAQDIYAQRVDVSGTVQWRTNGAVVTSATDEQSSPVMAADSAGGAVISWQDFRNGSDYDVYAQRINISGVRQWVHTDSNGIAISVATDDQSNPAILGDGTGGAFIAWNDYRSSVADIYIQHINSGGVVQWVADGDSVSMAADNQLYPTLVSDYAGGAILAWEDHRSGNADIYASRMFADGSLPIQMGSFTARTDGMLHVDLEWITISELNNYGFEVERASSGGQFSVLPNSFIAGHGTTLDQHTYTFTDSTVTAGSWEYRIKQMDLSGNEFEGNSIRVVVGALGVKEKGLPSEFAMRQNYPNPFNPQTTVQYDLPAESRVRLTIYNALGQVVATLADGIQDEGYKQAEWNASNVSSGVYFYRLEAASVSNPARSFVQIKKMVLVR